MMKIKLDAARLVRKCVENFQAYIPGRPISEIRKKYGLKKIIKLASNENPLGPSKKVYPAVKEALNDVFMYPVGNASLLRETLARKYGLRIDEIIAGNGTDEIIEIIGKTFLNETDEIVVSAHAFIRYKMTGELMNCVVKEVPMINYTHDLDAMLRAVNENTKVVFIANPNNPTGTYVRERALCDFLAKVPRHVLICLDEAYYEYAVQESEYPDGIELYKKGFKNLVVTRTFSKIFGLAGLRVGYAVGDPMVIDSMDRVRPPFNVNSLAQAAAAASISDTAHVKKGQRLAFSAKRNFYEFCETSGIKYLPSAANFVLIYARSLGMSGKELFETLLAEGIIIREMSEYKLDDWARITISVPADMKLLCSVLSRLKISLAGL
jgi:histidinol-phosphate aminotransferase